MFYVPHFTFDLHLTIITNIIYNGIVYRLFPTLHCNEFKLQKPLTEKRKLKQLDRVFVML